jgi:hypothetical protein
MNRLYTFGRAYAVTLVLAAISANAALALESTWLVGGVKPTAAVASDSENVGSTVLTDDGTGVSLTCSDVTSKGTIGPGSGGEISSVTLVNPTVTCTSPEATLDNVTACHLPWVAKVALSGTSFLGVLSAKGAGSPCYLIEVSVAGILVDDTCEKAEVTTTLSNQTSDVNSEFSSEEKANCAIGGKEEGLISGTELILTESGAALSVSEG